LLEEIAVAFSEVRHHNWHILSHTVCLLCHADPHVSAITPVV